MGKMCVSLITGNTLKSAGIPTEEPLPGRETLPVHCKFLMHVEECERKNDKYSHVNVKCL